MPEKVTKVWHAADGKLVDMSSDTLPGLPTREAIALTAMAERVGVNAVSVLTPYFISPNADELYDHYVAIAKSTGLPILLYTNPARTGVPLTPDLAVRLSSVLWAGCL